MSRLVSRILLTVLMFPLASLLYVVTLVFYLRSARYSYGPYYGMREVDTANIVSGLVAWIFIALYWVQLWRQSVHWSARRVRQTLWLVLAAIVAGIVVAMIVWPIERNFGAFVGSALAPLLWVVGTIFVWRETSEESARRMGSAGRGAGLVCPSCGYNLTGLREARCPECGTQYTLDELFAAQPARAPAEIETAS